VLDKKAQRRIFIILGVGVVGRLSLIPEALLLSSWPVGVGVEEMSMVYLGMINQVAVEVLLESMVVVVVFVNTVAQCIYPTLVLGLGITERVHALKMERFVEHFPVTKEGGLSLRDSREERVL